jgi:hypothetical protein
MDEARKTQIIEELKAKQPIGYCYLHIARVPKNVYARFIAFANNDEFASDFGFALKYLLDYHEGNIAKGTEYLEIAIEQLAGEIAELKKQINTPAQAINNEPEKVRRTLNGKVIG